MLPKAYEPQEVEEKLINKWQEAKLFTAKVDEKKKPFVIVIPPPNITGALHMGHALNDTLQDALIRSHRMFGQEAYWVPGTDHGGIATQNVIEKKLAKEQHLTQDKTVYHRRRRISSRFSVYIITKGVFICDLMIYNAPH